MAKGTRKKARARQARQNASLGGADTSSAVQKSNDKPDKNNGSTTPQKAKAVKVSPPSTCFDDDSEDDLTGGNVPFWSTFGNAEENEKDATSRKRSRDDGSFEESPTDTAESKKKKQKVADTTSNADAGESRPENQPETAEEAPTSTNKKKPMKKKKKKGNSQAVTNTENGSIAKPTIPTFKDIEDADHCETPLLAYKDLEKFLDRVCEKLGKERATLRIYDPYFCTGKMKDHLWEMGFLDVYYT